MTWVQAGRSLRHILLAMVPVMLFAGSLASAAAPSRSVYQAMPQDPAAIVVQGVGDGRADDTAALQQAIDAAAAEGAGAIVFVPEGRYRLTRTLLLRSGVRVFGVGRRRPVFVLAERTPGFGEGVAAMVSFTGEDQFRSGRPAVPPRTTVPFDPTIFDGTQTTFYSALSNVDFDIGEGNQGAVAVRFRVAQHAFLRHVDMRLGSAFAGVYHVGNEVENVRFFGGRYGIVAEKTAPTWPFTLIDSHFEGQQVAGIREHEAVLTLVNVMFRDMPVGIEIDRGYSDMVWGKDVRFANVSDAGIVISMEDSTFTQVGFENAAASATPVFARLRESGRTFAGVGDHYEVRRFSHGLAVAALGETGTKQSVFDAVPVRRAVAPRPPAIRALPPVREWVSVRDLGVAGDDRTDDTAALQRAIDTHRVLYMPTGRYRVTRPIRLRADTVLIALHPDTTQLYLPDEAAAYAGIGDPVPLLESARGGAAIVSGLGLWTGGINPRATALLWRSGARSMVNDVRIHGPVVRVNGTATGATDPAARPDGQQASIWVTDGGGGTFAAIWSPNTLSSSGFHVSDTDTSGHVYGLSAEHHYRHEIVLRNVANWEFLGAQTEQEARDGPNAFSIELSDVRNILLANYRAYRVTRSIKPVETAVRLFGSNDVRFRNVHINAESGFSTCDEDGCGTFARASKFPFDNAMIDAATGRALRERQFGALDIGPAAVLAPEQRVPAVSTGVRKLADGFYSAGGGAVDAKGNLFFIDRFFHRIYSWSTSGGLRIVTDPPLDPVNLAVDGGGRLMVLSSEGAGGTVYSIDPAAPDRVQVIAPTPAAAAPGAMTLQPGNLWANGEFADQIDFATYEFPPLAQFFADKLGAAKPMEYASPDGSLRLPAYRVWAQGGSDHRGWRWSDPLDAYSLVGAQAGERIVLTNSSENRTYEGLIAGEGRVTELKVLAERGGESAVRAADGTLYVANGQVFVYSADGTLLRRIDVPERPLQLLLGGADRRTLYIISHHSLHALPL
ncbi:glycosyl hydrolase family 28-related protein [Croceibacterium mercuriale]|nr:glycosyl hydrolase family 28-related protein [Croceibacterium mercuriale]